MLGHVAKKQRIDRVQDSRSDGYLHGIKVSAQLLSEYYTNSACLHHIVDTATCKACTLRSVVSFKL